MGRIKGKNTRPELAIAKALIAGGWAFETHARDLPGRPDIVFRMHRVAVFVDGDFWHGWRFPVWRDKLSEKWELKIEGNRRRDARNHRRLRRMKWKVVRLWEHKIENDVEACVSSIVTALTKRASSGEKVSNTASRTGHEPGKPAR